MLICLFQVVENDNLVLSGGYAELNSTPVSSTTAVIPSTSSNTSTGLKSTELFEQMSEMVKTVGPELVPKIKAVFLWKITKDGKTTQWSEFY